MEDVNYHICCSVNESPDAIVVAFLLIRWLINDDEREPSALTNLDFLDDCECIGRSVGDVSETFSIQVGGVNKPFHGFSGYSSLYGCCALLWLRHIRTVVQLGGD